MNLRSLRLTPDRALLSLMMAGRLAFGCLALGSLVLAACGASPPERATPETPEAAEPIVADSAPPASSEPSAPSAAPATSAADAPAPASSGIGLSPVTVHIHETSPPAEAKQHLAGCHEGKAIDCHAAALDAYYQPSSPQTDQAALDLFTQACNLDYAPSCSGLGVLYETVAA